MMNLIDTFKANGKNLIITYTKQGPSAGYYRTAEKARAEFDYVRKLTETDPLFKNGRNRMELYIDRQLVEVMEAR